jgi:nanoRNase/pAp phosphatase (c-di-AMP/oligoRNAs hydrolase)
LLKEQQRREKAAKAGGGGGGPGASGRRVTYKYEDDIERGLMEGERASARWR